MRDSTPYQRKLRYNTISQIKLDNGFKSEVAERMLIREHKRVSQNSLGSFKNGKDNTISQIKLDIEFKSEVAERMLIREHKRVSQNSLGSFKNGKWYKRP